MEPKAPPGGSHHVQRYRYSKAASGPALSLLERPHGATVIWRKKAHAPTLQVTKTFSALPQPKQVPRKDALVNSKVHIKPLKSSRTQRSEAAADVQGARQRAGDFTCSPGHFRQPLSKLLPKGFQARRAATATQTSEPEVEALGSVDPPHESMACQTDAEVVPNADFRHEEAKLSERRLEYLTMGDLPASSTELMDPDAIGPVIIAGSQFLGGEECAKFSRVGQTSAVVPMQRTINSNPNTIHEFVHSEVVDAVVADTLGSPPFDGLLDNNLHGYEGSGIQRALRVIERTVIGQVNSALIFVLKGI